MEKSNDKQDSEHFGIFDICNFQGDFEYKQNGLKALGALLERGDLGAYFGNDYSEGDAYRTDCQASAGQRKFRNQIFVLFCNLFVTLALKTLETMNYLNTPQGQRLLQGYLGRFKGKSSLKVYRSEIKRFFDFFQGGLDNLKRSDFTKYRNHLDQSMNAKTIKRKFSILNQFFKYVESAAKGFKSPIGKNYGDMRMFQSRVYTDKLCQMLKAITIDKQWAALPDWVFINQNGKFLSYSNFIQRKWRPAAAKAGFKNRTPHDMRHTYATLRISKGHGIAEVSKEMGHSATRITYERYYKWIPFESCTDIDDID